MKSAEHWLVHNHTQIEVLLGQCRDEAENYDWWALNMYIEELIKQLRFHLAQEEEVLYPAYDAKESATPDLTKRMVEQHSRIVEVIRSIYSLIENKTKEGLIENIDKLVTVLQAHNREEEEVFLPYARQLLHEDRESLAQKLDAFNLTSQSRVWGV